jgi:mannosyltransferase OCH1-like enzyme
MQHKKADLLRLELLNLFGGVYIDMDFEPLVPLDFLHYCYDFYIGIGPLDTGMVQISSGIIGTIPNHPIIKAAIEAIPANYANPALTNSITRKTGPVHLTRQFIMHSCTNGLRDCALPAIYFYPMGSLEDYYAPEEWIAQGSLAVHHWAKTWNKPEYRRARFRQIKSWGTLL